jgi:ferredoxin
MRIELDPNLCQAYGNCLLSAPEVFELTQNDLVVRILQEQPDEPLRAQVEEAVTSCPVQALTLVDS